MPNLSRRLRKLKIGLSKYFRDCLALQGAKRWAANKIIDAILLDLDDVPFQVVPPLIPRTGAKRSSRPENLAAFRRAATQCAVLARWKVVG
jgi:hypothetical protein